MDDLDLTVETVLDSDIQFLHPLCTQWEKPKAVLLTGATGFLGAYLLNELLQKTDAVIFCLPTSLSSINTSQTQIMLA